VKCGKHLKAVLLLIYVHLRVLVSKFWHNLVLLKNSIDFKIVAKSNRGQTNTPMKKWGVPKDEFTKIVLADYFPIPEWCVINGAIAEEINSRFGSTLYIFSDRRLPQSKIVNLDFIQNYKFLQVKLNFGQKCWRLIKLYKIFLEVTNPDDVINFEIDGVNIGLDVYESTLRLGYPTVKLQNLNLYRIFFQAITEYIFFQPLFEDKKVVACLLSHDNYVGPGSLAKMANKYCVPVILANPYEINIVSKPFENYQRYLRYKQYFMSLDQKSKESALELSKKALEMRLTGSIGIGMRYQIESAFENTNVVRQLSQTQKKKILVLTHDYYDNPHGYSRLPFRDFWEWLLFLSVVSRQTDYEWYIKCHKDYSLLEIGETEKFIKENPNFKLINPETSFHQLSSEGIDLALTCFGTVGHELPLLGIPVVNASHNPHISYNFNLHAPSLEGYREILRNSNTWKLDDMKISEIYEFYYVHYFMIHNDDYLIKNFSNYLELSNSDRHLFLSNNLDAIKGLTKLEFSSALENRRKFSVEKCLSVSQQDKFPENFFI
jgi:hypothetical protein